MPAPQPHSATLFVLGNAPELEADLRALGQVEAECMAINRAGLRVPLPLRWWATYHADAFVKEKWHQKRAAMGANMDFTILCHQRSHNLERLGLPVHIDPGPRLTGSSVLFGVLFGLKLGYPRVIVAGAPLEHPGYRYFRDGWRLQSAVLAGRVTSLSGWTKTFLEGLNHGA